MNFPILRPADAYLLYAEALINNNKASQAKEWIDAIRQRADLSPLDHVPTMDQPWIKPYEFIGEGKHLLWQNFCVSKWQPPSAKFCVDLIGN